MYSNSVLDFIEMFKPERKVFWEKLNDDEKIRISNSPIINEELVKCIYSPEKYPKQVEKLRDRMTDLEFYLQHPECCYDVCLYHSIIDRFKKARFDEDIDYHFNSKYEDFFKKPENQNIAVPKGKNTRAIYSKIMKNLPERYRQRESVDENFFGYFLYDSGSDDVIFGSDFEWIFFKTEKDIALIPAFIEYRNQHFLEWIYQMLIENKYQIEKDEDCLEHLTKQMERKNDETAYKKRFLRRLVEAGENTDKQITDYVRNIVTPLFQKYGYQTPVIMENKIVYKSKNVFLNVDYEFNYSLKNLKEDLEYLESILQ